MLAYSNMRWHTFRFHHYLLVCVGVSVCELNKWQKEFSARQHVVCWILFVAFAFDHHPNGWILSRVHRSLNHFDRNGHPHCYCCSAPFFVWWLVLVGSAAVGMGFGTIQYPNGCRFLNIPVNDTNSNKLYELKEKSKIMPSRWTFYTYLRAVN